MDPALNWAYLGSVRQLVPLSDPSWLVNDTAGIQSCAYPALATGKPTTNRSTGHHCGTGCQESKSMTVRAYVDTKVCIFLFISTITHVSFFFSTVTNLENEHPHSFAHSKHLGLVTGNPRMNIPPPALTPAWNPYPHLWVWVPDVT